MIFCRGCFMPIMNAKKYIYDDAGYCENWILKKLLLEVKLIFIEIDCCSECGITDHYCYIYNGRSYCKECMIKVLLEDKVIKLEEV